MIIERLDAILQVHEALSQTSLRTVFSHTCLNWYFV